MLKPEIRRKYIPTIGIECHVQFKTVTKLFSGSGNDARAAEPNTLISHIDIGLPGALPVLNQKAVELGIRAAFALNTEPQKHSSFDRKHYFYPDLPLGYQITQFYNPIIRGGSVIITIDGQEKTIGIHVAHLEADAGKSMHPAGKDYSLVDYNRAGTPLLEIVSEPEMHTAAEAKAYAQELYLLMRYADVSDCNMFYGNMRFDVNVSVSTDLIKLGTRTETKNINSFKSVEKTVEYEIERQIEQLEKNEAIVQETRGWDDAKQKTISQRTKEEAHDYRYMPEPDIPPIELTEEIVGPIRDSLPIMPREWRARLASLGMDSSQTDTLLAAEIESSDIKFLSNIELHLGSPDKAKFLANWYVNTLIPIINEGNYKLGNADHLQLELDVYELLKTQKLNSTNARILFTDIATTGLIPANLADDAQQKNLIQNSDEDVVASAVAKVLADNPQAAQDVRNGEMKAIGFLVGQVMKQSKGSANPQIAQELIKQQLDA